MGTHPITMTTDTPAANPFNLDAALADLNRRRALADAACDRADAAYRRAEAERVVAWEAYKAALLANALPGVVRVARDANKIAERKANAASGRRSGAYTRRINLRLNLNLGA